MTCPHCAAADRLFDDRVARKDLRRYLRRGPDKATRLLLDAIGYDDVRGRSLIDVGGGVGVIQHELASRGASPITDVDAAISYLETAREQARRLGYAARATYLHGDFVQLSDRLPPADLVTLDRVVCCYPDASILLDKAALNTRRKLGLVWPRDRWWARVFGGFLNTWLRIQRTPFRFRVHPDRIVTGTLLKHGLVARFHRTSGFWQVAVWERPTPGNM